MSLTPDHICVRIVNGYDKYHYHYLYFIVFDAVNMS